MQDDDEERRRARGFAHDCIDDALVVIKARELTDNARLGDIAIVVALHRLLADEPQEPLDAVAGLSASLLKVVGEAPARHVTKRKRGGK